MSVHTGSGSERLLHLNSHPVRNTEDQLSERINFSDYTELALKAHDIKQQPAGLNARPTASPKIAGPPAARPPH
jgi:hypothetical protein